MKKAVLLEENNQKKCGIIYIKTTFPEKILQHDTDI